MRLRMVLSDTKSPVDLGIPLACAGIVHLVMLTTIIPATKKRYQQPFAGPHQLPNGHGWGFRQLPNAATSCYVRRALLQLSANPERGKQSCLCTKNLRSLAKGLLCAQGQIPETNVLLSDRSNVVQSSG
jgi:hypothetical protein